MSEDNLLSIFDKKYDEFIGELRGVFPELLTEIEAAHLLATEERVKQFRATVLPFAGDPKRDQTKCPGAILPGVVLTEGLWEDIGQKTRDAIQQYLTIMSFCVLLADGKDNVLPADFNEGAMNDFMKMFKSQLGGIDFSKIADKFGKLFGSDVSGGGMGGINLPERFLNGHIARFAKEIIRDINPEDFGLDAAKMADLEKNPSMAIEMIMNIFKNKPDFLQNSMKRVGKRIQAKVLSGEIRPHEIAREAEELMKEFTDNPAFSEILESFRGIFGFEDMDIAKAAGKEGSARLAIVKDRLRKKMDAKKAASNQGNTFASNASADAAAAELIASESSVPTQKRKNRR